MLSVAVSLVAILSGCATTSQSPSRIVWPEPPLPARIEFIGVLRNQDDVRPATSPRRSFADMLLGVTQTPTLLRQPMGVATSRDGQRLYVTDYAKPAVLVFDFQQGTIWPLGGPEAEFVSPFGITVGDSDQIYVVDSGTRRISVYDAGGSLVRSMTHESLKRPTGIAVDESSNRLYVADSATAGSADCTIKVFDLQGAYLTALGAGDEAGIRFYSPTYLALDAAGHLYVTDTFHAQVQVLDPEGHPVRTIGERGDAYGMFDKPKGVALDAFGNVYVVDSAWSNVQMFNSRGDVLLFFGGRGQVPGLLFNPTGLAIDRQNRIYVADAFNGRVAIYQLINTTAEDSLSAPSAAQKGAETL